MDCYVNEENLSIKTEKWLREVEPFNKGNMKLNFGKSALLVIDMQKFFLNPNSPSFTCGGIPIIPNIQQLISTYRKLSRPVIFTRHAHHADLIDAGIMEWWWEGMCIEGTAESEIHDQLAPLPNEKTIIKRRYSAFYNTDLETILRCQKIEDIVITGVMTNMCCESTARDAYYRDYNIYFTADATGTINEEMHRASLLNLSLGFACITTTDKIIKEIEQDSQETTWQSEK